MKYTLDATNKTLGRLATEAATILMGKNDPSFARNILSTNTVEIVNAGKLKIDPRKMATKTYKSFSGYPGGLKLSTMAHVAKNKGNKTLLATAIRGMLPDNRLRKDMLKHLTITE